MKFFRIAVIASLTTVSGVAVAVTDDGDLDTTSTGTSDVTVTKQNTVQISGIDTIDFQTLGYIDPATPVTAESDMCVFSSTGTYTILLTSTNGAFNLNDNGNTIDYTVTWADAADAGAPVAYNTVLETQAGSNVDPTCENANNATLTVTLNNAQFNSADAGTYTDTLTMQVSPE